MTSLHGSLRAKLMPQSATTLVARNREVAPGIEPSSIR
jgi:hypothetical protein